MKVTLIERGATPEQTRDIPITKGEFLIGRGPDCDLRLRASSISRHHCMIRLGSDDATVLDLGSSNGTFLNGQRVRSQAGLMHGDELRLGEFRFTVALGDQAAFDLDTAREGDPLASTAKLPPDVLKKKPAPEPPKPAEGR